jgi:hypothetical protein
MKKEKRDRIIIKKKKAKQKTKNNSTAKNTRSHEYQANPQLAENKQKSRN